MHGSTDWSLRLRALAALAVLVLANAALLGGLALLAAAVLSVLGLPVPVGTAAVTASVALAALVVVALQARYGYRRALSATDAAPVDEDHDLHRRVARLATAADVPMPTVAVAETDEPNSLTAGNGSSATIVVTRGLLDRLDDDQLDAVLAHEVAHLANRDATVATAIAAASETSRRLFASERKAAEWLHVVLILAAFTTVLAVLLAPLAVPLLLGYIAISLVARTALAITAASATLYARTREYAADRTAAALTGDPGALVSALETLDGDLPDRDARLRAGAALGIVARPVEDLGSESEEEEDDYESPVEKYFPEMTGPHPVQERAEQQSEEPDWSDAREWVVGVLAEYGPYDDRETADGAIDRATAVVLAPVRWVERAVGLVVRPLVRLWRRLWAPVERARTRIGEWVAAARARLRRFPSSLEWRPPMHPPTGDRIDRLRELDR